MVFRVQGVTVEVKFWNARGKQDMALQASAYDTGLHEMKAWVLPSVLGNLTLSGAHMYVSSRVICYMHTTCPIYVINYCKKLGNIVCSKTKVIRTYMITTL